MKWQCVKCGTENPPGSSNLKAGADHDYCRGCKGMMPFHDATVAAAPSSPPEDVRDLLANAEKFQELIKAKVLCGPPPLSGVPSLVELSRALAICGGNVPAESLASTVPAVQSNIDSLVAELGEADHFVFVLSDGLGTNHISSNEATFLRSYNRRSISSTFPSTTATALTSLATGCWAGQTGIFGWYQHFPEKDVVAALLPFIEWKTHESLSAYGIDDVADVVPAPSLYGSFSSFHAFFPENICGSKYSTFVSGGEGRSTPYETLGDVVEVIASRIKRSTCPTFSYLYTPIVDHNEHKYGSSSTEALAAVQEVNDAVQKLQCELAGINAKIVLTADHGQVTPGEEEKVYLDDDDPMYDLLAMPPYSEARCPHFRVKDGCHAEFVDMFHSRFGDKFLLLVPEDVIRVGLYGPVQMFNHDHRARLGDYLAVGLGKSVFIPRFDDKGYLGMHAGLHPDEMTIPLVIIPSMEQIE